MKIHSVVVLLSFFLAVLLEAQHTALSWTGTLPQGGELRVDPDTHRAWRIEGNQARPMWDGTHRMEDGSVVIIRDGNAVPNKAMLQTWESGPERETILENRPCEQLERQVCGFDNQCRMSAACLNARSMLNQERDAQRRAPFQAGSRPANQMTDQCKRALTDPAFAPCINPYGDQSSIHPCHTLVEQVCGANGQCAQTSACAPARQLLRQEQEEHATSGRTDQITPSGAQCLEAIGNPFFTPCTQR